ncbi:MAG TPA: bifunctional nuclease family protein [Candidatus Limnocylindrales bacterium]|nr:bifunctional nuclease family protein [Candidatus Limnocylindrales bacterium]
MNAKEDLVRMTVGGVTLDPLTKTPIVVLKDDKDEVTLPIWIGLLEATSMATELEGVKMARPMTHDLLKRVVEEVGATVERIVVTELKDNTFYASIDLHIAGRRHTLDSRPSDAISLALRTQSPIFVARAVIEASRASDEAEGEPETPVTQDLSEVAPEEWDEILEKLDPSDFKYKM